MSVESLLTVLRRGQVWLRTPTHPIHTCTRITAAQPRVQTIHPPLVWCVVRGRVYVRWGLCVSVVSVCIVMWGCVCVCVVRVCGECVCGGVYVCVYMYMHIYIYTYIKIHVYMYMYMYTYIDIHSYNLTM
jgi:hypothetical protein